IIFQLSDCAAASRSFQHDSAKKGVVSFWISATDADKRLVFIGNGTSKSSARIEGFFTSRLYPALTASATLSFQARSLSTRSFHHLNSGRNSENSMGAVFVYVFRSG